VPRPGAPPKVGEQVVLGLFHAVLVFHLLFHPANTRSARLRGRRGQRPAVF
jgi:hypothetical protein